MALRIRMALSALAAVALTAPAAMAQQVGPQTANTLPPPPYARDEAGPAARRPASYGGEQGYDRYGGGTPHARVSALAAQATPKTYAGPRLGWMGKTEEAAVAARPTPYTPKNRPSGYAETAYTLAQPAMSPAPAMSPPNPPTGWTYVPPIGQAAAASLPPAPTSIYDAPMPVTAPTAPTQIARAAVQAPPQTDGVRHYSLHREYGLQPDPIPLPPQFFGATADLTQPETAEPSRKTTTADGKSHNAVQPEGGQ